MGFLTSSSGGVTEHDLLTGLTDDDHTQYPLGLGRAGGQTIYGGLDSTDGLFIYATSNIVPSGYIKFSMSPFDAGEAGKFDATGFTVGDTNINNSRGAITLARGSKNSYFADYDSHIFTGKASGPGTVLGDLILQSAPYVASGIYLMNSTVAGVVVRAAAFEPKTNDSKALGTGTISWSDLYLASGGVISWANGNYTITHSTGLLTTNGTLKTSAPAGGTAQPWKFGSRITGVTVSLVTSEYIELDVNGTLVKLGVVA